MPLREGSQEAQKPPEVLRRQDRKRRCYNHQRTGRPAPGRGEAREEEGNRDRDDRAGEPMDGQQQRRVNEAAEQFTSALVESFRAVSGRGERAQEQSAQLTQEFFNRVVENLHTQAEDTRQMGQQLADQQQRATEAGQQLTQESVNAYMDFVNSMFSYWQGGAQQARRKA